MKQILVSIIIPAYNTSEYIAEMLECVIRQTYSNLEIIIINDGSTDETLNIVQGFADKDSRMLVIDIPNGGVSNARNIGIEHSHGEKIFFWDSDDVVEPETVEHCLKFADTHAVSSVLYGYSNRINNINSEPHKTLLHDVYRGDEIRTQVMPHFIGHSFDDVNRWIAGQQEMRYGKESTALWRIMCDSRTIKENGLRFDRNLSLGEDTIFINTYFLYEQSVGYLDETLYHLAGRETGANLSSLHNAEKRISDKTKLIYARLEIDKKAMALHWMDTHRLWEGTLVFSCVEMALRMAKNKKSSVKGNYHAFMNFINIPTVNKACTLFTPPYEIKSIPFLFLKGNKVLKCMLFFVALLIPNKLISKFI